MQLFHRVIFQKDFPKNMIHAYNFEAHFKYLFLSILRLKLKFINELNVAFKTKPAKFRPGARPCLMHSQKYLTVCTHA